MSDLSSFLDLPEDANYKVCSKCGINKHISCYSPASGTKSETYKRTECKACNNNLSKRREQLKKIHPYPGDDYRCPICDADSDKVKDAGGKKNKPWVVDHNHETGEYRGYLCHNCNRFFDLLLQDNRLERIPKYIESYSNNGN